ncbi:MAG: hypothetical protein ING66_04215 [Rhodocyclaceae bacterium]|nr:hypothetical protein [Rhodocyclaceae bacterium]MCA3018524.1 hypothetical protein [Rhodocyclaceae bacterium]MCA3026907.1 hypothetical protein [Rhodocyclaceae bacterium]MCA3027784.1 hypothetical protein [Rhodocyclaceae bacterium]MCA3031737.1 hypothetical protein [Rhodocyclaceae bacterium]
MNYLELKKALYALFAEYPTGIVITACNDLVPDATVLPNTENNRVIVYPTWGNLDRRLHIALLRTPAPNNLPMLTSLIEIRVIGAKIDSIGLLGRIHRMILREID